MMNTQKLQNAILKAAFLVILLILFSSIGLKHVHSQILTHKILDLRTKLKFKKNHQWQFHPGDSPVMSIENGHGKGDDEKCDNSESSVLTSKKINFAWAQENLKGENKKGWIDNFHVQLAWKRFRDKNGNRPFKDMKEYIRKYNGYGWYRSEFTITNDYLMNRFRY